MTKVQVRKRNLKSNATAAIIRLKAQFNTKADDYHKLCFAVIETAIKDLFASEHARMTIKRDDHSFGVCIRKSAIEYLSGDIIHAQYCDVDPDWVKRILKRYGLLDVMNND